MEAHRRLELVDALLEEVTLKRHVLENTLAAQEVSPTQSQPARQHVVTLQEQYTLQAELAWWEKAQQGLTIVQNAFAQIEQSERQRGVRTRGAGR